MEAYFRPMAIVVEIAILMAVIYALLAGAEFTLFDLGLDRRYQKFIRLVLTIVGCMALAFFIAHLIAFYPRLSSISRYPG